jgi:hypothetical protein
LDGSPQGKTAWLTEPYHVPPARQQADYHGYPAVTDEEAVALVILDKNPLKVEPIDVKDINTIKEGNSSYKAQ